MPSSDLLPAELAIWGVIALCIVSVVIIVSRGDRLHMGDIGETDD
jgi:hypothetical protein